MDIDSIEQYDSASFGNWQQAIECTLQRGYVREPHHRNEIATLAAFREKRPVAVNEYSGGDWFLLGHRTRSVMVNLLSRRQVFDVLSGDIPPDLPSRALDITIPRMIPDQLHSILEIAIIYHLEYYLHHLDPQLEAQIVNPQFLSKIDFMFLCGYQFIWEMQTVMSFA
jgi:hypothetical protein